MMATLVAEGIYLSVASPDCCSSRQKLDEMGVTHVVNATVDLPCHFEGDISYHRVPLLDCKGSPLLGSFPQILSFIRAAAEAAGNVLIHSGAGSGRGEGRGAAIAAAALVDRGISLAEAIAAVTASAQGQAGLDASLGGWAGINSWQLKELVVHERNVRGDSDFDIKPLTAAASLHDSTFQLVGRALSSSTREGDSPKVWGASPGREEWAAGGGGETFSVVMGGHVMRCEVACLDPRILVIDNFVTAEEAAVIRDIASREGFHESLVPATRIAKEQGTLTKELMESEGRTSTSVRVPRTEPIVSHVAQRAAFFSDLHPFCSEAVQVVHYDEGQQYVPHNDWFQEGSPMTEERLRERGQRLVSFFTYLSEGCKGGHTRFPRLGLSFKPRIGRSVMWWNCTADGIMDERTLHCGCPVEGGIKWGMNTWMRERPLGAEELTVVEVRGFNEWVQAQTAQ